MNEEEKEVVELLKHCQNTYIEYTLVTHLQLTTEEAKILLNLVENQQKEIEKLKSKKYIFNAETNEIKEIPISDDYINKGKIKEKISILEKLQREFLSDDEHNIVEIKIIAYKELLGE